MVLCSMKSAILLLFRNKESNDDALCPVSSFKCICRIAVMANPGKIYCLILFDMYKSSEHASIVTKPRTLGLFGHRDYRKYRPYTR